MEITLELIARAISHGIFITTATTKTTLIRAIQCKEEHYPCFRTDDQKNCRDTCEWTNDCKDSPVVSSKQ